MSEPAASPNYFAALTLAIVTLRAQRDNAEKMKDAALVRACNDEMFRLETKRDRAELALEQMGGA
jgi:hypothetical protein